MTTLRHGEIGPKTTYRTEGMQPGIGYATIMEGFTTEEEARLSFANTAKYPLNCSYRVVEVTERVVFH